MERTPIIIGLSPQVKDTLENILEGQVCCRCGAPAGRFTYSQRKKETAYFCHDHMPDTKRRVREKKYNQHPATPKAFLKHLDNDTKKAWNKETP